MSDRPCATSPNAELAPMISACIKANYLEGLRKLQVEMRYRKSSGAKRLKARIGKYINTDAAHRQKNPNKPSQPRRSLGPDEKSIFDLERLAETAMLQDLVNEVQDIASLLNHRTGKRAVSLTNKITVYLWDHGLVSL